MPDEVTDGVPLVGVIDAAQLEPQLTELVGCYRAALRVVSRLPKFGRVKATVITKREQPNGAERRVRERRRVARPFVRLFVEAHIRARIEVIIDVLSIETISVGEGDAETKKFELWIKNLNELRDKLRGWGRYYGLLTKAPIISALLPFIGAVVLQLVRIDISGTTAFGSSVMKLMQANGWSSLFAIAKLAAVMLLYLYMLFAAVVVGFGFRGKRAIFNAGETMHDLFMIPSIKETEQWDGMPRRNIYHTENELFKSLGVTKAREFPLDLVVTVVPYFLLGFASIMVFGIVQQLRAGVLPSLGKLLLSLFSCGVVAIFLYSVVAYYKERRKIAAM